MYRENFDKMSVNFIELNEKISYKLKLLFPKSTSDTFLMSENDKVVMPSAYAKLSDNILNFEVRKNDIWLVSYPRTGSTWAQEMIWLLGNELNYEKCKIAQHKRSILLESSGVFSDEQFVLLSYLIFFLIYYIFFFYY